MWYKYLKEHSGHHFTIIFRRKRTNNKTMTPLLYSLVIFLLAITNIPCPTQMQVGRIRRIVDTEEIKTLWRAWGKHQFNKSVKHAIVEANITLIPNGTFEMFHSLKVSIQEFRRLDSIVVLDNTHCRITYWSNGPLTTYVKLRVAYASGMPGMFSPPQTSKETVS